MTIRNSTAFTHEIRLNGVELLSGDRLSGEVIFFNLTGRNFERGTAGRIRTHAEYLEEMENAFGVSFNGALIELAEVGKPAVSCHLFRKGALSERVRLSRPRCASRLRTIATTSSLSSSRARARSGTTFCCGHRAP